MECYHQRALANFLSCSWLFIKCYPLSSFRLVLLASVPKWKIVVTINISSTLSKSCVICSNDNSPHHHPQWEMVLCDLMELGGWRSGPHLVVGIKSKWMGIRKASWDQLQRMRRKSSSVEKSWNLMTLTEGQTRKRTWTLPRRSPWLSRRQQLLESRQQRLWWSAAQVVSCSAASNFAAASTPWARRRRSSTGAEVSPRSRRCLSKDLEQFVQSR